MAIDIVLGKECFIGIKLEAEYKSVIYVATEDDEDAMACLLQKTFPTGCEYADYEGLRYLFESGNLIGTLDAALTKKPADLVIIDTYTDIFSGDMNRSNDVRTFLTQYKDIAQKHKCVIVFMHHTGKRTDTLVPSKDNTLGSQGFESKVRVLIELRRDFSDNKIRHLCILKGNYIPDDMKDKSFELQFENFEFSTTGRRIDFSQLAKPDLNMANKQKNQTYIERAIELKTNGLSHQKIAEEITQMGHKVSKSTIGNWLSKTNMN